MAGGRRPFRFAASSVWLVALLVLPIWIVEAGRENHNASTPTATTNLPEQMQLCEKDLDIQILQETQGLTRVDATPTHAAMHPGWPEAVMTLGINLGIFLWNRFTEHGVYLNRFVSFLLPVGITGLWFATLIIAQTNSTSSAGWVSASLTTTAALLATVVDWFVALFVWGDSRRTQSSASPWALAVVIMLYFVGILEVAGVWAVVVQRFISSSSSSSSSGYGALAYDITDSNGCTPRGGLSFLQRGARSRIFSIVQLAQAAYSVAVMVAMVPFALRRGKRMVKEMMLDTGISNPIAFGRLMNHLVAVRGAARFMQTYLPVATLAAGVPLAIYGGVIATRGVPVVISGDCMLVELSPRFGFLDSSEIDLWWRVLVGAVGH